MGTARRSAEPTPKTPELAFDITQEIDPALADLLRSRSESTLTDTDFDDVEIEIAKPQRRSTRP
jgi:hypothetical protein